MTPTAVPSKAAQASPSQTLSRGIRALEILAAAQAPLTIAELADAMGVHRSVAYRILRTLEDHSLLVRDDAGRVQPGPGLAVLARGVARDLQTAALPELTQLANALAMSAFVAVWDRDDCVTIVTVDPRHTGAAIVQHPGSRHPISAGAPGIAIQSAYSEADWHAAAPGIPYRPEAGTARQLGFAASHDEVIRGVSSVAVPVRVPAGRPAALAVVYIRGAQNPDEIAAALVAGAGRIEAQLG
ncbi:helix-turn-helix domain-containing protein [Pseudarthrobacter sp. AL07]|uniref:IclR family transcriptional regulator n=1 Tax=unclassified Pseudarthrobacter TaxID=2647000 RepID=UPI00249CCA5D|nr:MULTISPECIES: helix-turn-helix domain-containing protein [unclassified Pseudarthrobacter]MDI3192963.1 helix-turn-helix domain-containing protein [Pseudarthrobacter sp. AL20]MDI3207218.1 helix-turn-helix domain-containing protein [Pseudarthrobacter sp. AL07]